ncbi:MAG: class F sortase [Chloroflexota bacterium]|nr:class F sortase [Chloroflexota bacterium]
MKPQTRITTTRAKGVPADHLRRLTLALTTLLAVLALSVTVAAKAPITSTQVGEMPTTGGMRPGPVGLNPPTATFSRGVLPSAIRIDKAQVDAEVETVEIVDGVMQNPTGPWVVSWYKETARLGEDDNTVMAGHVDYWDVGPAVFFNLKDLAQGDQIQVTGEDGSVYAYQVEWIKTYTVAELTPERIQEIVGPTDDPALTLITCGGEFDYATGEYLSRMVVRANRVG